MNTRVAAVVGAGPGLGAAVARRFARESFTVALMARNPATVEDTCAAITAAGGTAIAVAMDATDASAVTSAFARVADDHGPVDVLVYNAGAFHMAPVLELDPDTFERAWRVNCLGAFLCARAAVPGMLERKAGTVLLTGATGSLRGGARFSGLAVGKFGLRALAQSLARECQPGGVHVAHVIVDGMIDTDRVRRMVGERDPETLLSPDAIADTYWHLHTQHPSAWTHELDVRPHVERF